MFIPKDNRKDLLLKRLMGRKDGGKGGREEKRGKLEKKAVGRQEEQEWRGKGRVCMFFPCQKEDLHLHFSCKLTKIKQNHPDSTLGEKVRKLVSFRPKGASLLTTDSSRA